MTTPEEMNLGANYREEEFLSSLGKIHLRWPRSVEDTFKKAPTRAVTDAVETVARAIKTSAFPDFIKDLNADWKIVFLDSSSAGSQVPGNLLKNCHPGWMTPPANIYIVSDFIGGACEGLSKSKTLADKDLAEVLIHEFGHVIEYRMLKDMTYSDQRRAEGFATWFEMFASRYSSLVSQSEIKERTIRHAQQTHSKGASFQFELSSAGYSRAALYFEAIASKKGIPALMDVYKAMALEKLDFFSAVKEKTYWNRNQIENEVSKIAGDE